MKRFVEILLVVLCAGTASATDEPDGSEHYGNLWGNHDIPDWKQGPCV